MNHAKHQDGIRHDFISTNHFIMYPPTINDFAKNYLSGLRNYLTADLPMSFQTAHEIGSDALTHGLEILGLARIHDVAFNSLLTSNISTLSDEELGLRADLFFTEVILPIEKTHAAALNTREEIEQASDQLSQHTRALSHSNRVIQEEIMIRRHAEIALKYCESSAIQEQEESLMLKQKLQEMMRKILLAVEEERSKMSLTLQHEVAQVLLVIKVRLLALENEASVNQVQFSKEITATHWLVETASKTLNHLIREFSSHHDS
jgi:signal transduction histidine kinase